MHSTSSKIAVIGSGIAGITAAYWLARKGIAVTVYESERHHAMGTSHANGAQLSVCNAGVWNTWPMVLKGLKWMFSKDAPFHVSPVPDPAKMSWLLGFLYHTANGSANRRTVELVRMALSSRVALAEMYSREGIVFEHVRRGILHIYRNHRDLDAAMTQRDLMESAGCEWDALDAERCIGMEPALSSAGIVGGIYTRGDSTGDMHVFCNELARVLADRYQVEFRMGHRVAYMVPDASGIVVDGVVYDHVVIAAGVEAQSWSRKFGEDLGIYPVKGYSVTIDLNDDESRRCAPWVSMLDDGAKIVCSRLGHDRLRVAGTAELVGNNRDIMMHRVEPLLAWTRANFPGVSTRIHRPWAGLRPMTPNMMPRIGASKTPGVWYHAGHGHLGWSLAPGTARTLADMIVPG